MWIHEAMVTYVKFDCSPLSEGRCCQSGSEAIPLVLYMRLPTSSPWAGEWDYYYFIHLQIIFFVIKSRTWCLYLWYCGKNPVVVDHLIIHFPQFLCVYGRGIIQVGKGMNGPFSSPCKKCRYSSFTLLIGPFDCMFESFNKRNNADECLYRQCAWNMNFPFLLRPATPYQEHCLCHKEKTHDVIAVIIGYLCAEQNVLSDCLHKTRCSVACEDPLAHRVSHVCYWFITNGIVTTEDNSH